MNRIMNQIGFGLKHHNIAELSLFCSVLDKKQIRKSSEDGSDQGCSCQWL